MCMKVYTRTGDQGDTSLRWGERVPKDALRVEAYGAVDEANAHIGLALAHLESATPPPATGDAGLLTMTATLLRRVQRELFDVGADLAAPPQRDRGEQPKVQESLVPQMERDIDALSDPLPALRHFILPGGSLPAAALHTARTAARRAERRVVALGRQEAVDGVIIRYLNRLSDLLFVAARAVNHALAVADPTVTWDRPPR